MKCVVCGKKLTPKLNNVGGNRKKYCSLHCRNAFYYKKRGGADYQREYFYKRNQDGRPKIKCEICGKYFRQVGTHVVQIHKITARQYREEYGFDVKKGQLPEDYKELKAKQAIECGGAVNLITYGKKYWFKKGQKGVGVYERSPQTMERLRTMKQLFKNKK